LSPLPAAKRARLEQHEPSEQREPSEPVREDETSLCMPFSPTTGATYTARMVEQFVKAHPRVRLSASDEERLRHAAQRQLVDHMVVDISRLERIDDEQVEDEVPFFTTSQQRVDAAKADLLAEWALALDELLVSTAADAERHVAVDVDRDGGFPVFRWGNTAE